MEGRIEAVGRTVNVKIKVGVADFHFGSFSLLTPRLKNVFDFDYPPKTKIKNIPWCQCQGQWWSHCDAAGAVGLRGTGTANAGNQIEIRDGVRVVFCHKKAKRATLADLTSIQREIWMTLCHLSWRQACCPAPAALREAKFAAPTVHPESPSWDVSL